MPRYIIKLSANDQDYYLEWSTIVDAPITYGMSLKEFKRYYRDEYGRSGMENLAERLARVEKAGTSSHVWANVDVLIRSNRAGKQERRLSKQGIIKRYCIDRAKAEAGSAD